MGYSLGQRDKELLIFSKDGSRLHSMSWGGFVQGSFRFGSDPDQSWFGQHTLFVYNSPNG